MATSLPIQSLDAIDIIGKRRDGGLDLGITVSSPLRNTEEHLDLVVRKINTYVHSAESEDFKADFGACSPITIVFACAHKPDREVLEWLDSIRPRLKERGFELRIELPKV